MLLCLCGLGCGVRSAPLKLCRFSSHCGWQIMDGQYAKIEPEPGTLIMFPGWMICGLFSFLTVSSFRFTQPNGMDKTSSPDFPICLRKSRTRQVILCHRWRCGRLPLASSCRLAISPSTFCIRIMATHHRSVFCSMGVLAIRLMSWRCLTMFLIGLPMLIFGLLRHYARRHIRAILTSNRLLSGLSASGRDGPF